MGSGDGLASTGSAGLGAARRRHPAEEMGNLGEAANQEGGGRREKQMGKATAPAQLQILISNYNSPLEGL